MVFGWFDTSEIKAFAKATAQEYARLRKSVVVRHDSAGKREQKFDKLTEKVKAFNREKQLNFYKKATLLNELRDGLRSENVPEAEIAAFVDALLLAPIS